VILTPHSVLVIVELVYTVVVDSGGVNVSVSEIVDVMYEVGV
jgi:hypothetical protein